MWRTTPACGARVARRSARVRPRRTWPARRRRPTPRPTRSRTSSARPPSQRSTRGAGGPPGTLAPPLRCRGNNLRGVGDTDQSERRLVGVRVLEAQPDLAEGLDDEQAALARRHVVAVLDSIEIGPWRPEEQYANAPAAIGLLVIDGMVTRDLQIAGRWCSELLGPGALLRPWDFEEGAGESVQTHSSWNVLEPLRVAVLDERFARVAARWPQLTAALVSRTLRRSRRMGILLAISTLTRVDERVTAMMWHLADRWGHVTRDGVVVPVPLTHDMIGRLVGAHRPSGTSALGELQRSNVLSKHDGGWLLHGEPPDRLTENGNGGSRNRGVAHAIDPTLATTLPALVAGALF